jgi:hypothetical protein
MQRVSTIGFPLSTFATESQRIISKWGPERFANGLYDAVSEALKHPAPQASVIDRLLLSLLLRR